MKIITSVFICSLFLFNSTAQAKVRSIIDWDGGSNPYKEGPSVVSSDGRIDTVCARACPPPYSLTITNCNAGQIMVHCPNSNCGYYHYCRPKTNKDEVAPQNDEIGRNIEDMPLTDLLREIDGDGTEENNN